MADVEGTESELYSGSKSDNQEPLTSIDATLVRLPAPKQNQPPKILPDVDGSYSHSLVNVKGLQGGVNPQSNVEANVHPSGASEKVSSETVSDEQKGAAKALIKWKRQSWPSRLRTRKLRMAAGYRRRKDAVKSSLLLSNPNAAVRAPILGFRSRTRPPRTELKRRPRNAAARAPAISNAVGQAENVHSAALKSIDPEMVHHRTAYLRNLGGFQDQPLCGGFSIEYLQSAVGFIKELEISRSVKMFTNESGVEFREVYRLEEILSKEMDPVFLQQLLNHILNDGAETATNSTSAGIPQDSLPEDPMFEDPLPEDPVLAALVLAPRCDFRANAIYLPQIRHDNA